MDYIVGLFVIEPPPPGGHYLERIVICNFVIMSVTDGKRTRPQDHTPPTKPRKKSRSSTCPVCDLIIHDDKQQSIYCEGKCQAWFHRKCTGMSKQVFSDFRSSDESFLCIYCVLGTYKREIDNLKQQVSSLTTELTTLKKSTESDTINEAHSDSSNTVSNKNYPSVASNSSSQQPQHAALSKPPKPPQITSDKKFNLIFYGITESPVNTPKMDRQQHDFHQISSILSSIDTSLSSAAIKDFYRLGKFSVSKTSPRPILVKFLRTFEVTYILSKKGLLQKPISIKPDMSRDERASEAAFLRERWSLIQDGIDRKSIKLRSYEIYVNNELHGRLEKSNNGYYTVTHVMGPSHGAAVNSNVPSENSDVSNNPMHTTPPSSPQSSQSNITHD